MWRRACILFHRRPLCSASSQIPSLYSFLQPSLFTLKPTPPPPPISPSTAATPSAPLTPEQKTALETTIASSIAVRNTDEAWKSFKSLTHHHSFPSKSITNSLIAHLSSLTDVLNLKRAFASVVYLIEKNPNSLDHETLRLVFNSMVDANTPAPAFTLVKCMFRNRVFVPFDVWGGALGDIRRRNGGSDAFLRVFFETCRVALDEKLGFMKPGLSGFNAALEGCCWDLESVSDAQRVIELMSLLDVRPDESSFGFLGYLYSVKGLEEKIIELEDLMRGFGFQKRMAFFSNIIRGYVKSGDLASVSKTILRCAKEGNEHGSQLAEETCCEVVKGHLKNGGVKALADLIIESQVLEPQSILAESTIGFGIVNACVNLGMLDKAHGILDEMNTLGSGVGLGVYLSILNAYIREQRTAEAAQLVAEISESGLQLDVGCYDSLIETSMSCQDFQSAFSLFRDMRGGRIPDLSVSYLTIMTSLTENNRPELMAAFLDEVVEDPRIEVSTHDWNSIIHAFCKAGRLEDARRTFRRMIFLQFEPNEQTYLSLISGYVTAGKYFSVLMLWNEVRKQKGSKGFKLDHSLVDAFLYALVKGGFFDAAMQVVEKSQELKIFVGKWRYKQAYMETHKKLKISKLRRRNSRKVEALIAFKNWAGLNA